MRTILNSEILEQLQLIDSLLSEQESVIEELDHLNDSIESLIDELAEERKSGDAEDGTPKLRAA